MHLFAFFGDVCEDVLFVVGVLFDCVDEVWYFVLALFEEDVDVTPCLFDLVVEFDERVVRANPPDERYCCEDDDCDCDNCSNYHKRKSVSYVFIGLELTRLVCSCR